MTEIVEYTHPDVFTRGVAEGWAEPTTDPTEIDWEARQATAAIPFPVIDGRPVNPSLKTPIQRGRNELGHWGEAQAADALVTARTTDGRRRIVLIMRRDGHGLALPGGYLNVDHRWVPVETAMQAAPRELQEETGLCLPGVVWTAGQPRVVPDPRGSDESWMVTTPVHAELGTVADLPALTGADDAECAFWALADSYQDLERCAKDLGRAVFPAHREMLQELLDGAT